MSKVTRSKLKFLIYILLQETNKINRKFFQKTGVNHHPGFKKHLLVLAASTLFVVLVYTLFPVCAQRGTAPDRADCFADHLIIQRSSFAITLIVDCTICADSELTCGLYCVNIGTEEQKLPTVFCLLSLDHLLHFFAVVPAAGIFHSVRSDYKHGVFRHILRSCVLMNISNVMNRTADGIPF